MKYDKQVDLWIPEHITIDDGDGNIYSGIVHIETGADGYIETYDGEVLMIADMNTQMIEKIKEIIDDYKDIETDMDIDHSKPQQLTLF